MISRLLTLRVILHECVEAVYDRYESRASKMPHIHYYPGSDRLFDAFGIDMVPVPCPYFVDRLLPKGGLWRFSFDS